MRSRAVRVLTAAVLLLGLGVSWPSEAVAPAVPTPTLSDPPAGVHGHPLWDSWYDLKPFGYTEREHFVSGTATSATGAAPAPYTTRIIVFRPTDPKRFNGTVLLDWVNVTAQFENAVDTMEAREMLMREGFAFVHVSAQAAGICCSPLTPQVWDPVRYADLDHPGDDYAFSIFSQVARAMRTTEALGGLKAKRVLAAGQSQSASRLYSYIATGAHDAARVVDGFLVHGGGQKTYPRPLTAPVLHLLSDNEANPAAPSTDPHYRLWEVAATAHSDFFIGYQSVFGLGPRVADQPPQTKEQYEATLDAAGNYGQVLHPMLATCVLAGSTVPMHYATSTALHQLDRWVRDGVGPAPTPRFRFVDGVLAKDEHQNTLGGIRMPPVEVPVASYRSTSCPLGGLTVPFTDLELQQAYPTFADYQARMKRATDTAVRSGWLLPPDAVDQMRRVCTVRGRYLPTEPQVPCAAYRPPPFGG